MDQAAPAHAQVGKRHRGDVHADRDHIARPLGAFAGGVVGEGILGTRAVRLDADRPDAVSPSHGRLQAGSQFVPRSHPDFPPNQGIANDQDPMFAVREPGLVKHRMLIQGPSVASHKTSRLLGLGNIADLRVDIINREFVVAEIAQGRFCRSD